MENQPEGGGAPPPSGDPPSRRSLNTIGTWVVLLLILGGAVVLFTRDTTVSAEISYKMFREQLEKKNIKEITSQGLTYRGKFLKPPANPDPEAGGKTLPEDFWAELPLTALADPELDKLLLDQVEGTVRAATPTDHTAWLIVFYFVVFGLMIGGMWYMSRRAREQMLGGGVLGGFARSPAKRYESGDQSVTFDDVAGLRRVKAEMQEVVEFLKDPAKFERLGGRVPKGILLMGPPGTGKTLLARAIAGEAGAPFYSINGSEFIQMFVGVGASRVRDLFATAKEHAPAILFIDEIDAVGRHRGAGVGGGHDEREQTLNQILSEMDGFTQNESVIVIAATNRPDVLDPALLRPGRFDRHVTVDRPTYKGRLAILKVHSRQVPLADDVNLDRLAAGSVGLTGADLRNLVNEAALWATRSAKDSVEMADFEHARDKVLMGSKREEVLSEREKRVTAYHEAGHTILAWLSEGTDRVHKVSIIPRGRALGATHILPDEDRLNLGEHELYSRIAFTLAGRAAEKLQFDELSAGAENDLRQATDLARRMVTHWGMSERLGPVAFRSSEHHPFLGRDFAEPREFSEHTAQLIDEEVVRILREAAARADQTLLENRHKLVTLAEALEKEEELDESQIEALIGPPTGAPPPKDEQDQA